MISGRFREYPNSSRPKTNRKQRVLRGCLCSHLADVIAVVGQGIDAGAAGFAEMVNALRNGSAYVNVHTTQRPGGEIRGALGEAHDDDEEDD